VPTVQKQIARKLRREIIRGDLPPGSRLPGRQELTRIYDASLVSVQGAVRQLIEEGFVTVGARKQGTFVAERPPHLFHYKLIFPHGADLRSKFWRILHEEAERVGDGSDREISFFYGLDGHRAIGAYEDLVNQIHDERVAGLIFAGGATELLDTPLLLQPGLPRAAIAADYELPGIPKISADYGSFFARALDYLLDHGRKRIACLSPTSGPMLEDYHRAMASRGLESRPIWTQFADVWDPLAARRIVQLMLHSGQAERPDALIVGDDNFLESAALGVADSGTRAPDDFTVVSLVNFPSTVPAAVPVTRFGFDVHSMLHKLIEYIDMQRSNQPPPEYQQMPAISETEYEHTRERDET